MSRRRIKLGYLAEAPPPERQAHQRRTCTVLEELDRIEAAKREPLAVEMLVPDHQRRFKPEPRKAIQ